ncbi:MAG: AAA family ATPase [Mariprofundaceae bacterium]|nr:AAA family ATPase [Mariprofundaceae bacterium]
MLQANFYPHACHNIHLWETHASWVVLTGLFAYKVKKSVNFGFLDFSSLDKRRHFCTEELRLNRQLAPQLYLDVLPISYQNHHFSLGDDKNICEYCVQMRQFADEDLLDARMQSSRFDPEWMDELAKGASAFHASAKQSKAISAFGAAGYVRQHIHAALDAATQHPEHIDPDLISALYKHTDAAISTQQKRFTQRMHQGYIRDCHGDLHLGNIAIFRNRPLIFDCIEFNPEYRAIDTLSDTAFLVMDCMARTRPDLAFRFLSRYLEYSGDYAGMPLFPIFLCYRACVRGKVACLLADDDATRSAEKEQQLRTASDYFHLAAALLNPAPSPCLYVIGGLSGSGKSHLALKGCGPARAVIIRSDATRKRIAAAHSDLELYGDTMTRLSYDAMYAAADTLLAAGWPVILDATFLSADERQRARDIAGNARLPFRLAWLDVPETSLRQHVLRRQKKGSDISDADITVLEQQLADYRRPTESDTHFLASADTWPAFEKHD